MRRALLIAIPLAFIGVFFAWPVAAIFERGLTDRGGFDLGGIVETVTTTRLRHIALYTVGQATLSTALTLAIGIPIALVLEEFSFLGSRALRALVVIPFVLPTIAVGAAFRSMGLTGSLTAILIAHAYFNVAIVVRIVGAAWSRHDVRDFEVAAILGAGRVRRFVSVTVPTLRAAIVGSAAIVFLFCFTSFGVILVLGPVGTNTIETEIYRSTTQLLDLRTAAALTLVQVLVVVGVLGLAGRSSRHQAPVRTVVAYPTRPRGWGQWSLVIVTAVGVIAAIGAPMFELLRRSLARGGAGFRGLARTPLGDAGSGWDAVTTSLGISLVTTVLAVTLGLAAAIALTRHSRRWWTRAADGLFTLPLGVSAVTVGFGFLIALDEPPLDLRTSWWIIPIAHTLVALPFVIRMTLPTLRSIQPQLRDAAATLGAPPWRVWREVDLPLIRRAIGIAAGFAAVISLGEFGATLFIVRPETTTIPVAIFRALGRPGAINSERAMALSVILIVITGTIMLIADREPRRERRS